VRPREHELVVWMARALLARLLRADAKLTGIRVRELIEPLGFDGQKTIVDAYLRRGATAVCARAHLPAHRLPARRDRPVRPLGALEPVPVGHGETRRAWVVVSCLGYSRAGSGALVFSRQAPDVVWGLARCLWSLGALPEQLVWDREGCLHAGDGRPSDAYAAFCGQLRLGWRFCEPADPEAKGCVERLQGYLETNFEPGRRFASPLDYQLQLDRWFEKVNARGAGPLRALRHQ
jgi:hypothetical protein